VLEGLTRMSMAEEEGVMFCSCPFKLQQGHRKAPADTNRHRRAEGKVL